MHCGITSPKELLNEVFGNTKIIASQDLHGHLNQISDLYPAQLNLSAKAILYQHTLFPLYAPFIGEKRKKHLESLLLSGKRSEVYTEIGAAASIVKQPKYMRYCPACLQAQNEKQGEMYWMRSWQVMGANCCLEHGMLFNSHFQRHNEAKRHTYQPLLTDVLPITEQAKSSWQTQMITQAVVDLLSCRVEKVPELQQWGIFYRELAIKGGLNKGQSINHCLVKEKLVSHWGYRWLKDHALLPECDTNWLVNMFRKHRKSFSYLHHILVISAFLGNEWNFSYVISNVTKLQPVKKSQIDTEKTVVSKKAKAYQKVWQKAVKQNGVKFSRDNGYGDIYAWLYRHSKQWLLAFNQKYRTTRVNKTEKVNWRHRDLKLVRKLIKLRDSVEINFEDPRHSRNWYLNQFTNKASLEKNLAKMPLSCLFFSHYCETITDYQIRRISRSIIELIKSRTIIKRWRIIRFSGLSEERITSEADKFLREILRCARKHANKRISA